MLQGVAAEKEKAEESAKKAKAQAAKAIEGMYKCDGKKKMHMIHPIQLLSACRLRLLYTTPQRVCETTPTEVMGSTKR